LTNNKVAEEIKFAVSDVCGNKVIGLPGDRIFTIGGTRDINGKDPVKDNFEIANG